jgi:hypothetical protein
VSSGFQASELISETAPARPQPTPEAQQGIHLWVTLDLAMGCFVFEWSYADAAKPFARGVLAPTPMVERLWEKNQPRTLPALFSPRARRWVVEE